MGKSIVILGRGNVALSLDEALRRAGHSVLQMWHRGEPVASGADFYIIAVSDNAIAQVLPLVPRDGITLHTSGSTPMLTDGVLYPMQTFTRGRAVDWHRVPLFIEGKEASTLQEIRQLAETLSRSVTVLDSERRRVLHMSAVWACNFTNHMWDVCSQILEREGIPFSVMLPLIDETVDKIHTLSPHDAQTGPARRADSLTIDRHMSLLDNEKQEIYRAISDSIINQYNNPSQEGRG